MALERLQLEHLPGDYQIFLGLYRDVQNAKFLHEQLLARNSDFQYAFIDASAVFSRLHILSAVYKAATAELDSSLRTPNVQSEIVASLSPSNHIIEAYRRFGVSPSTKDLVVVKIVTPSGTASYDSISAHLEKNVEGTLEALTDEKLAEVTDLAKVSKYYKLNGLNHLGKMTDPDLKRCEMESVVLAAMALRGT